MAQLKIPAGQILKADAGFWAHELLSLFAG
jgi:hypothetical protein